MQKFIVLIPAYNPKKSLYSFIEQLIKKRALQVIVVNDGSDEECNELFEQIKSLPCVSVINHAQNMGKGRAIKIGLAHILKNNQKFNGVITCGADGQHDVKDIQIVTQSARIFADGIILGVRDFHSENLPKHSFFTNRVMSVLFDFLFHKRLLDLQTGLRFLPRATLEWIHNVPGESFNFDTNVIVEAIKRKIPIYEVPIGKARMSKGGFLQYEEVMNPRAISKQMLISYLKKHESF